MKRKIDHSLNKDKEAKIVDILKKNNCTDIFRDAFIKNEQELYENNRLGKFTKYKFSKKSRDQMYNKLDLLLSLRLFGGLLFLRLMLYKIQLAKEIFMIELELGKEVFVPKDMSQSKLPLSFRYYDPIINMIKKRMLVERREYYGLKKALAFTFNNESASKYILEKLGITNDIFAEDTTQKLTFQYDVVNKQTKKEISHHGSPHVMQL